MEKIGGVYFVPCKVNGIPLKFIFDTGASDVSISLSEAVFMIKNGYISQEDLGEEVYYGIANGDVAQGTKLNIKEIEIEGLKMYNVSASIVHELKAPLLLGLSFIERLGKIQIDKSELLIFNGSNNSNNFVFDGTINSKKDNAYVSETDFNSLKLKYKNISNSSLLGDWNLYEVKIFNAENYRISNVFDIATLPHCLEDSKWFLNDRYNGQIQLENSKCAKIVKKIKWEIRDGDFRFKYNTKNNSQGYLLSVTNLNSRQFELTQKIDTADETIFITYKFELL